MATPRFAVLSTSLPPSWSGQAVVWLRLLQGVDPDAYCLIGPREERDAGRRGRFLPELAGRRHEIRAPLQWSRGVRFGVHRVRTQVNHLLRMAGVPARARRIAAILREERCDALVAGTGDMQDLPAAMLAARSTGVRLFVYMFDYYSHQWTEALPRIFAHLVERWIVQRANGVIVPNEGLGEALRRRYGIRAEVVRNPCPAEDQPGSLDPGAGPGAGPSPERTAGRGAERCAESNVARRTERTAGPRIVYTGAIYGAQLDSFHNLLQALGRVRHAGARLHAWTAIGSAALRQMGIVGPVEIHPHAPPEAVPAIQREADILFLPLAFASPYDPEIVRTSSPGKMGEYLASGRPILVHAPADSFLARYFRRHRCGWVVDRKDPAALAEAIDRLLDDEPLGRELAANAWERSRHDFDVEAVRARFFDVLGIDPARGVGTTTNGPGPTSGVRTTACDTGTIQEGRESCVAGAIAVDRAKACSKRRVVAITPWFPSPRSPYAGVFVEEMSAALAPTCDITVLVVSLTTGLKNAATWSGPEGPARTTVGGLTVVREEGRLATGRVPALTDWAYGRLLRRGLARIVAERGRPDLIQAYVSRPTGIAALAAARREGIPLVLTEVSGPFSALLDSERHRRQVREVLSGADAVVAPSPSLARELTALVPAAAVRVVGSLVRTEYFTPGGARRRLPGEPFRFLAVGRLVPEKGFDCLLAAAARLAAGRSGSFDLEIAGDGPEREALAAKSRGWGLGARCRFLGSLTREQVRSRLQDCDALVSASRVESFGLAVGEALACGKPVIATRCGGPEFVLSEGDGLLVPPDDPESLALAMASLVNGDFAADAAAIRAGVERRFGPEAFVRNMTAVFESVGSRA